MRKKLPCDEVGRGERQRDKEDKNIIVLYVHSLSKSESPKLRHRENEMRY